MDGWGSHVEMGGTGIEASNSEGTHACCSSFAFRFLQGSNDGLSVVQINELGVKVQHIPGGGGTGKGQQHCQRDNKLPCGQLEHCTESHSKQCRIYGFTGDLVGFQHNINEIMQLQSISHQTMQNARRHRRFSWFPEELYDKILPFSISQQTLHNEWHHREKSLMIRLCPPHVFGS